MADYLESNRKEVEAFWKNLDGGFRWDHYFNFLGVLELQPNVKGNNKQVLQFRPILQGKRKNIEAKAAARPDSSSIQFVKSPVQGNLNHVILDTIGHNRARPPF